MNDGGRINRTDRGDLTAAFYLPCGLIFIDGFHDYDSVKADYEHFRPYFTHDTVVIFHDDDWAGVHRLITEKAAESDIAILQQADSLVVCRYTGAVQVKLNPDDFATLKDEDGNAVDVPDGGDLAEAIATAMGVPGDLLSDAEPSTVSAAKEVRKPAKPRKKK